MNFIKFASIALSGLFFSVPAFAQWGGLGEPDWGWKPKVCHVCISAIQVGIYGGIADGEKDRFLNDEGFPVEFSSDGREYAGFTRVGFGPRLFVDAGYRQLDVDGDSEGIEIGQRLNQVRAGLGFFFFNDPGAALYARVGYQRFSEKIEGSIAPQNSTDQQGASSSLQRGTMNLGGANIGGIWGRGRLRIEAQYGFFDEAREAELILSRQFNNRLALRLHAHHLVLSDQRRPLLTVGGTQDEVRSITFRPSDEATYFSYGLGFEMRF